MSYEKEEDERSEINRDRVSGEGVQEMHRMATTNYSLFLHPLTAKAVPSPYKQGESAVRMVVVLCTLKTFILSPLSFFLF